MNNIFDLLILILLGGASILSFLAVLVLLLPGPVARTQQILEERGGRSTLLGLVNFVFFGLSVLLCLWLAEQVDGAVAAVFVLVGGGITLVLAALMIIGLAALSQLLGARIGKEATPFLTILRGGGLLVLAGLAPYVGWFLFTPLAAWAGLGAAIQTFVQRKTIPVSTEERR
jgi:hypothetical protein